MELVPPYNDGSETPTQSKRRKGSPPSLSMGANSNAVSSSASQAGRTTVPPRRPSPLYSLTEQTQSYHYGAQNQQHSSYSQQNQQYSSNFSHMNQQQQQQHWKPQQQQQQQQQATSSRHSQRDVNIFRSQQAYPQPPDNSMYCPESSFAPSSSLQHARHSPWNSSTPQHGMPQHHQQQQQQWNEFSPSYYDGPPQNGGDNIDQEERGNFNSNNNMNNMKGRGKYVCGKCGAPKKGHVCPYQPKLKRRADEPPPEMKNAAVQVEMDELMVIRRLNLEIQGFPETYLAGPLELLQDNVYSETYEGSLFSSSAPLYSNSTDVIGNRNVESNSKETPS